MTVEDQQKRAVAMVEGALDDAVLTKRGGTRGNKVQPARTLLARMIGPPHWASLALLRATDPRHAPLEQALPCPQPYRTRRRRSWERQASELIPGSL